MGLISRVSSRTYRLISKPDSHTATVNWRAFCIAATHRFANMAAKSMFSALVDKTRAQEDQYDAFRSHHEDMKHWYARKEFIRHNWDKYFSQPDLSEEEKEIRTDKLDCLSKVYALHGHHLPHWRHENSQRHAVRHGSSRKAPTRRRTHVKTPRKGPASRKKAKENHDSYLKITAAPLPPA